MSFMSELNITLVWLVVFVPLLVWQAQAQFNPWLILLGIPVWILVAFAIDMWLGLTTKEEHP